MAEQQQEFSYHNLVLYKSQTLGGGSYGRVCRAKCDELICAAKIMHPTLFDLHDPGTTSYLRRFEEECRLLSLARHPNIVQYLATYRDPETNLPVLLMELCDESLCKFLERSVGPLPYHTELNISHDIALALVYLHTNGLIHRDLTGNNVLMIAGVRAKVTDFGMSKLASVNPRMTPLTVCPGNLQYMSPEALEEPPSYTDKLDIFSFGVLQVQIMTRQFPDPGPRFQVVDLPDDSRFPKGSVRVMVPETERRNTHLQLISSSHPLKPIALNCLKGEERERPSAQQLCSTLFELKLAPQYAQSMRHTQTGERNGEKQVPTGEGNVEKQAQAGEENGQELESLRKQVQDLQQQDQEQRQEIKQLHLRQEQSMAQVRQLEQQLLVKQESVVQVQQQLQEQQALTETEKEENQQLQIRVEGKQRELQASEELVAQFQQSIEQKDRVIKELQQTISANEKNIQLLGQQVKTSRAQPQQFPVTAEIPQVTARVAQKDITKLRWKQGKRAPEGLSRGAVAVDGNTVYINSGGSYRIHSCQITSEGILWSALPDTRYVRFSLAVIDGLLTCVGGLSGVIRTNILYSLTGKGWKGQWSEVFPPMPTARSEAASVTTGLTLVVVGGCGQRNNLGVVEVMNIPTKQWTRAQQLPHPFGCISGAICGDQLYLGGGFIGFSDESKSVLTCSLHDLLPPQSSFRDKLRLFSPATKPVEWRKIKELPVTRSTLTTLNGHLLAIGGLDDSRSPIADVHCYDNQTDSWRVVSRMNNKRDLSLSAVLPEDQLLIMGGAQNYGCITSVEIGSLPVSV